MADEAPEAPETGAAPAATPSDTAPKDTPQTPQVFKVGDADVPLDELTKGYLRQSDYTKKTMKIAEERKRISEEAARIESERSALERDRQERAYLLNLAEVVRSKPELLQEIEDALRTTGITAPTPGTRREPNEATPPSDPELLKKFEELRARTESIEDERNMARWEGIKKDLAHKYPYYNNDYVEAALAAQADADLTPDEELTLVDEFAKRSHEIVAEARKAAIAEYEKERAEKASRSTGEGNMRSTGAVKPDAQKAAEEAALKHSTFDRYLGMLRAGAAQATEAASS
jgi:DNA repair exonuclease SbcCD ATPase subunit